MMILTLKNLFFFLLLLACTLTSVFLDSSARAAFIPNEECFECHSRTDLRSRKGKNLYIDHEKFSKSAHAGIGLNCVSCHDSVTAILKDKKVPHPVGIEPKCAECHEEVNRQYSKSLHAQISKKICYSCHNPHYSVPFRRLTIEDRKAMCLKCHDAYSTHRWLPQKHLHFDYLECASCHDMNAEIGAVFYIVEKGKPSDEKVISYGRLAPFIPPGKGLSETLDEDGNGRISPFELGSFLKKIREGGITEAALDVRVLILRPKHNFTDRGEQTRDCSLCHSENATFYSRMVLEVPEKDGDLRTIPVERQLLAHSGPRSLLDDFYLLGESKIRKKDLEELLNIIKQIGFKWIDLLGLLLVAFSFVIVTFHSTIMVWTRKSRILSDVRLEAHPWTERIWHLIHGLFVILLVLTGIQLRLPDLLPIFATFLNAVNLHNICGIGVLISFLFWIAYETWRGRLKSSFIISPKIFFHDAAQLVHYFGYLAFVGGNTPQNFDFRSMLSSMEKALFFAMMFFLIPMQIFTGLLMYDLYTTRPVVERLGGLRFVDAIHLVCAYILTSLVIIHTYFHTLKKYW